jgi:hypothetical protein
LAKNNSRSEDDEGLGHATRLLRSAGATAVTQDRGLSGAPRFSLRRLGRRVNDAGYYWIEAIVLANRAGLACRNWTQAGDGALGKPVLTGI